MNSPNTKESLFAQADIIRSRYAEARSEIEKKRLAAQYEQIRTELESLNRFKNGASFRDDFAPPSLHNPAKYPNESLPRGYIEKSVSFQYSPNGSDDAAFYVGIAGSICLLIGVFVPFVRVPVLGTVSYVHQGSGEGMIVAALSVLSFLLCFTRNMRFLHLPSLLAACLMVFTYYRFRVSLKGIHGEIEKGLSGNPFKGLAEVAVQSIQLEWGVAVLFSGIVLLCGASIMALNKKRSKLLGTQFSTKETTYN